LEQRRSRWRLKKEKKLVGTTDRDTKQGHSSSLHLQVKLDDYSIGHDTPNGVGNLELGHPINMGTTEREGQLAFSRPTRKNNGEDFSSSRDESSRNVLFKPEKI